MLHYALKILLHKLMDRARASFYSRKLTSRERPKSAPYLRLNKICEILGGKLKKMGENENVISELKDLGYRRREYIKLNK